MFNYHTIISPLDQFEIINLFSIDEPSYVMDLPNNVSMNTVICLYMYFFISFIIQWTIMCDNGYNININRISLRFFLTNIISIFNNKIVYIKKNKILVLCTILILMCFRYFVYNIFEALGTYNTVTVLVFIISNYWIIVLIGKSVLRLFKNKNNHLAFELYHYINFKSFFSFLLILITTRVLFITICTSLNNGILFFASKDVVADTSQEITFDINSIEALMNKMKENIAQTNKERLDKAFSDLEKDVVKLHKWEHYVQVNWNRDLKVINPYVDQLNKGELARLLAHAHFMNEQHTKVPREIISVEEYANIHKNLSNHMKDNWNKYFTMFKGLENRLDGADKEELVQTIYKLKKNIEFKQQTKIQILNSIKDKSKILEELNKK